MSSRVFFAELSPDPKLRKWLIGSIWLALIVGIYTIHTFPVRADLRWLGSFGWALAVGARGWLTGIVQSRWQRLVINADGTALICADDGQWQTAAIGANSVVLANLAWFDLKTPGGRRFSALLCGKSRESEDWRRLQVIWRHMGSSP